MIFSKKLRKSIFSQKIFKKTYTCGRKGRMWLSRSMALPSLRGNSLPSLLQPARRQRCSLQHMWETSQASATEEGSRTVPFAPCRTSSLASSCSCRYIPIRRAVCISSPLRYRPQAHPQEPLHCPCHACEEGLMLKTQGLRA